ncbi:CAT2 catalase [Hortaea werneckii]|nr:CAT2 catalase [Hortaea werneckii]KAI7573972.1 CAT2 catalase [Hortaea werneckii]
MAPSAISAGAEKLQMHLKGSLEGNKMADMAHDMKDVHDPKNRITTDFGVTQHNTDDWLKVANNDKTGPILLEDHAAREKINSFDHERIPERVVHARGAAAFGNFKLHKSLDKYSTADVLTDISRNTPLILRFSTVLGSRGSADTVRDVRGFAVKFYRDEGNWDIVGNNIPVFFIQDAMKFPDVIHASKPEPHNEVPQAQSARGGQSFSVQVHVYAASRNFHRKDLYEAIDNGLYPKWDFGVQTIPEKEADNFEFDPLDATKIWPEDRFPVEYCGELELNRNVDEYFTQTEQGRNFSYLDTRLSRLGKNWQELPVNRLVCPVMNHNRDGQLRHTITKGTVNYWPNRYGAAPPADQSEGKHVYVDYPAKVEGIKARLRSKKFQDHYSQAQLFYNLLSEPEKMHIAAALSFELDHCDDPLVIEPMCQRLTDIEIGHAQQVADLVGGTIPQKANRSNEGKKTKNVSQTEIQLKESTIESRRVAIIIADGYDPVAYNGILGALKGAKALPYTIGPRRSPIYAAGEDESSGKGINPAHNLEGMRSTMYDSIFVPGGADSIAMLRKNGRALHWVRETYAHLKAIGATGDAVDFIRDACQLEGMEFSTSSDVVDSYGVVTASKVQPESFKETLAMGKGAKDFIDAYTYEISRHKNFECELKGFSMMLAY